MTLTPYQIFMISYLIMLFGIGVTLSTCRNKECMFLVFTILFHILSISLQVFYTEQLGIFPFSFFFVIVTMNGAYLELRYYIFVFYHEHRLYNILKYSLRIFCLILIIVALIFIRSLVILEYLYYSVIVIYTPVIIAALITLVKLFLRIQLIDQGQNEVKLKYPKIISFGLTIKVFASLFLIRIPIIPESMELIGYFFVIYGYMKLKPVKIQDILQQIEQKEKELRSSENLYRNFLRNAQGIYYQTSTDGHYIFMHGNIKQITGFEANSFYLDEIKWKELIFHDDRQYYLRTQTQLIDQEIDMLEMEYRVLHKHDGVKWVFEHSEILYNELDNYYYLQGAIFDITERKLAELALITQEKQHRKEELRAQKLESLAVLAGGIAHDFNNILVSILGNIELLKLGGLNDSEINEIYDDLAKGTETAKNLTNQLLTFSKGGDPIKSAENIIELLHSVVRFVLAGSNCDYTINSSADIPPLLIDPGQISQVFHNLVLNAKQEMKNGGTIAITAMKIEENSKIRISIHDKGMGIPEEAKSKIFNPYFSTKAHGSGLGLATSYSIIKRHNGNLWFESELGKGTKFHIDLPIETQEEKMILKNIENGDNTRKIPQNLRILILDDQAQVHQILSKFLAQFKCEVHSVFDGKTAINLIKEQLAITPFHLVIMDLTIPGKMGGKEAIKRIRKLDSSIKAIVSSGYSHDPVMSSWNKYGFDAVLRKPYTFQELQNTLESMF